MSKLFGGDSESSAEPWEGFRPFLIGRGPLPDWLTRGRTQPTSNWLQDMEYIAGGGPQSWNMRPSPMTASNPFNQLGFNRFQSGAVQDPIEHYGTYPGQNIAPEPPPPFAPDVPAPGLPGNPPLAPPPLPPPVATPPPSIVPPPAVPPPAAPPPQVPPPPTGPPQIPPPPVAPPTMPPVAPPAPAPGPPVAPPGPVAPPPGGAGLPPGAVGTRYSHLLGMMLPVDSSGNPVGLDTLGLSKIALSIAYSDPWGQKGGFNSFLDDDGGNQGMTGLLGMLNQTPGG